MKRKDTYVRINSRVHQGQIEFIKKYAKENKLTEGETHRLIIQFFITANVTPKP